MILITKLYLCQTELCEIELFIFIKIDLALNNLQMFICHETQTNKKETAIKYTYF